jgi:Arc/MetJ-type ribon-helix-helix transcriptional regulator
LPATMVNVTFSLPEETVDRLRRIARQRGKRGSISEVVNAALSEHLSGLEAPRQGDEFFALRGSREVARAGSLKELASKLKTRGIDARTVEIRSSMPMKPLVRTGLRGTAK